ncbi:hypothetical protein ACH4TX_11450 [Streptomyces sp. NPDC021098]|uniref:hypothetical protein n=1 Tax=unclassified Streptomyces TaxID=2593676 RepID=UPI0037AB3C7B
MSERGERGRPNRTWRRHLIATAVSLLALGVAVAHLVAPDLKIDNVTVALLVIAVVPWLRELFTSIELPGGLRVEFRDVEQRIEAAERMADAALVGGGEGAGETDDPAAREDVRRLAAEYLEVRASMRAGSARTQRMSGIFARLVRATQRVADPELADWLASSDGGLRLAAYARLYAVPDDSTLDILAYAVTDEPLAFGQYWGIRALDKVVDLVGPDQVPPRVVRRLEDCRPSGADRAHLLNRLVQKVHGLT